MQNKGMLIRLVDDDIESPYKLFQTHLISFYEIVTVLQGYFYQISKGGHLRFWTFSKTNFGPFLTKDAKLWTFLYGV